MNLMVRLFLLRLSMFFVDDYGIRTWKLGMIFSFSWCLRLMWHNLFWGHFIVGWPFFNSTLTIKPLKDEGNCGTEQNRYTISNTKQQFLVKFSNMKLEEITRWCIAKGKLQEYLHLSLLQCGMKLTQKMKPHIWHIPL